MWTEEKLNKLLVTPSDELISDIKKINGDIMILGAGGKMGPTLCTLAKNAVWAAGIDKKIIAVSRFSDKDVKEQLEENGVEVICADLLDIPSLNALPEVENVIYMAGKKFGTTGEEPLTWAMNSTLPAFTAYKFQKSNIVVFSTGNIYPLVPVSSGGSTEKDSTGPVGEYVMSCLARERAFQYGSLHYNTKVFIYRLSYAVDLHYGILFDIANKILKGIPISVSMPCFNIIWQGSANERAIRGLLYAESPARIVNITGPETISVRYAAQKLGEYLGKEPIFEGEEQQNAYLNNANLSFELFGYPDVPAATLIRWQAEWLLDGGRTLDKPTHFEERGGKY